MLTIEWRTNNAYDTILILEGDTIVTVFSPAETKEIHDLLTDLGDLREWQGTEPDEGLVAEAYGDLVMTRSEDGTVLELDSAHLGERLACWFGARATPTGGALEERRRGAPSTREER